MCFHSQQSKTAQEVQHRFKAKTTQPSLLQPTIYNGFEHPKTPIITHVSSEEIQFFNWGLILYWAKDSSIQKSTLNARVETLHEKPTFMEAMYNRCLVISDSFFEWQWLDAKGKEKQKFKITLPEGELFAFVGIWSKWQNPHSGEATYSYAILTMQANTLISKIHNTKQRMPIIIDENAKKNGSTMENYLFKTIVYKLL